ncbi:MAG: alpha/beta hydrolase [Sphaerochaetaceae bacterium]
MKIKSGMIHPQLRLHGILLRTLWGSFSQRKFRLCNWFLDSFMKGRCSLKKMFYHQVLIPRPDGSFLRLCVYTPRTASEDMPALLWLHGGGFGLGIPEQDEDFFRIFSDAAPCAIVAPDYTRSVDKPYPAALDDCYQALLWMRDNCSSLRCNPSRLFAGGDSAGGGLCAAVSLLSRDRGEVSIAFQMPLYPMLDDRTSDFNDAPCWNSKSNEIGWKLYLGEAWGTPDVCKLAAPARETDFTGLPRTLTFCGDIEPFCNETERYVQCLKDAGIEVDFRLYPKCYHAFDTICPGSEPARDSRAFLSEGFARASRECSKAQPE